jgi:hypothetical protein
MEIFIAWVLLAIFTGVAGNARGRDGFGWFLLGAVCPLFLILVLILPAKNRPVVVNGEAVTPETHVRCPDCRELVRADARKCKHCGTALVPVSAQPGP